MQLKQYEIVSRAEFFKCDIQEVLKSKKTIKKWAYILHDKDDTAPHYHIYVNFGRSGVDSKVVADWFGLQESQVNKIQGRSSDMELYLIHGNDSQQQKHQYDPSEVIANYDFKSSLTNAKILGNFTDYSFAQQLSYVHSLPRDEQPAAYSKLQKLWDVHTKWLSLQTDRVIDVIFIDGKGGSGKTYYAKKLLQSEGIDFCVSSSSNDPFQDYLGQNGMILDDLRDDAFDFADLLKILDNNTASSVKSRFSNKVFNGKIIVITSSVPLSFWYRHLQYGYDSKELLGQLYRRISCYVHVTEQTVKVYHQLDERGRPIGDYVEYRNELQDLKKTVSSQRRTFFDAFDKIASRNGFLEE